jgi:hypothetical protein
MYCDSCGMPKGVGKANIWKSNGVIESKYEKGLRGILCDAGELNNLFTALSSRMGYDVTGMVIEAKRKDSEHYTRGLLDTMKESGVELPGPEDFFRIMGANYAIPGFGKVNILEYRENEGIVLEMEGVFSVPMAQGQAAGVFEAVVNRRGDVRWDGDPERGRVTVTVIEGEPELEKRIKSEVDAAAPLVEAGDREYSLCGDCNAPIELSQEFAWDVEEALIMERRSGKRFVFDNTRGIVAVMQVLVDELGEDVERLLLEISRAYAREYYLALEGEVTAEEEFERIALMGWGLPAALERVNGSYNLQIHNPFYSPVMAGRVWGLLEVAKGEQLDLEDMESREGTAYLSLSRS